MKMHNVQATHILYLVHMLPRSSPSVFDQHTDDDWPTGTYPNPHPITLPREQAAHKAHTRANSSLEPKNVPRGRIGI